MAASPDTVSMAMFCDFENVALGVRDANLDKFDIKPVLERLLLKGSIVVKKAYCDWDRYKGFKATMHEANFELIEIPHVRQSGKNSADIRMVVDALDLCYTKAHVDTFVIVSGDSDFSPLVSKLRENAKYVIGVGVKQSTSDLLVANCDEFIFYDDLVRESQRSAARRDPKSAPSAAKRSPEEDKRRKEELEVRKSQAVELAVATFEALVAERGDSGKIWASMLKEAIKRRKPDFSESYYGFRSFGNLLEEAQTRGLLDLGRDEKSGAFVYRSTVSAARNDSTASPALSAPVADIAPLPASEENVAKPSSKRRGRGGKPRQAVDSVVLANGEMVAPLPEPQVSVDPVTPAPVVHEETAEKSGSRRRGRGGNKRKEVDEAVTPAAEEQTPVPVSAEPREPAVETQVLASEIPSEKKPASRNRRPRKPKPVAENPGA